MTTMHTAFKVILIIGGLSLSPTAYAADSLPRAKPEDVGMSSERLERIGPAMQRHIDAGEIAGVVTLVARLMSLYGIERHSLTDPPLPADPLADLESGEERGSHLEQ